MNSRAMDPGVCANFSPSSDDYYYWVVLVATTLYVTVQDGGRPSLTTSGQLTVVIDNYDATAVANWRALVDTRSVSGAASFLSLPLAGLQLAVIVETTTTQITTTTATTTTTTTTSPLLLQLAIIVAIVTATVLLAGLIGVAFVVAHRHRNRKYVVNDCACPVPVSADGGDGMTQPPRHMLVVDDVIASYDDVIVCCDDNCSEYSDVIQVLIRLCYL